MPYQNLRNRNPIGGSGQFIVESKLLVQRLVDSSYEIDSILVDNESVANTSWLERGVPIYVVDDVSSLIGFNFHRGALACGLRRVLRPAKDLFVDSLKNAATWNAVYLYQVQDPENMGSIFRTCAALGIDNVIVGPSCVDPYARRVVRVSMGTSLKLNIVSDNSPRTFLGFMNENDIPTIASTLSGEAISLRGWQPPLQWTLFLGNEAHGLPDEMAGSCTHRLTIPMRNQVDSLNVSNAASIFLYILSGNNASIR
jgi:tRNA G18 (ribose-2'-O)-methylase SpoU